MIQAAPATPADLEDLARKDLTDRARFHAERLPEDSDFREALMFLADRLEGSRQLLEVPPL